MVGSTAPPMDVVFCWHFHQPDYRLDGRYRKPWTWLHAVKDYTDMAAHLESVPGARAVVNFSPALLEQLLDYPPRIRACLEQGDLPGDMVLDALASETVAPQPELIAQLLRVNLRRVKERFSTYADLHDRAMLGAIDAQEAADLAVWYVIAWLGESLRDAGVVQRLVAMQTGFGVEERRALLSFLAGTIEAILPRYRALSDAGKVELSVTPHSHPIMPLLLDFEVARQAMPGCVLPSGQYPGGEVRCDWHLAEAQHLFAEVFGRKPRGCWPSEGALSEATLGVMGRYGFHWAASGSQVLHGSLEGGSAGVPGLAQLYPWQYGDHGQPACFFRDDGLSDLIGFEYSNWQAGDAVADFIGRLEALRLQHLESGGTQPVLSIIMDGENAWEYYHENGWAFLQELYTQLAASEVLRLRTFSQVLEDTAPRQLPRLQAGSWVHGSLGTWIGDPAKNRAWDLLSDAKRAVDAALAMTDMDEPPAWVDGVLRQLAICEASDWAWWLGSENVLEDAPEFDALYRQHLSELYRMIGMAPPANLETAIGVSDRGGGSENDAVVGAMRRSDQN